MNMQAAGIFHQLFENIRLVSLQKIKINKYYIVRNEKR